VLISYPDLEHMGALPYAYGKLGLRAPIYSTVPVYNMGELFLYEAFFSMQTGVRGAIDTAPVALDILTRIRVPVCLCCAYVFESNVSRRILQCLAWMTSIWYSTTITRASMILERMHSCDNRPYRSRRSWDTFRP